MPRGFAGSGVVRVSGRAAQQDSNTGTRF